MIDFFESLVFSEQPLRAILEQRKGRIEAFECLKMASLYADFAADVPVLPTEVVCKEIAARTLALARTRLNEFGLAVKPLLDREFLESLSKEEFKRFQAEHPGLFVVVNRKIKL